MTPAEILIQAKNLEETSDKLENLHIHLKTSTSQTLAHSVEEKKQTLDELIPPYLQDYHAQFEKGAVERFPESRPYDHAIDLKPDFKPQNKPMYQLNLEETRLMNEFIDENLRKGYIHESKSPMASPFFFVTKKEKGALRPCQDYRTLNEGTVKNAYPLPLVGDLLN
ncbi:hypothetical protein MPER_06726 [Moniliophthora perniciosa FA553]|nr:hypothetical protein MPER_06726 [Moniliophthora perniciosa FA553]